jgi:RNA polymerase sigma-70 factor (ECF subfamily)
VELARWDELLLVRRCQEGSEAAFAELVRRHRPRLYSLAYRLTANREAAEDVVQEAFVAAFRAIGRFEPRSSLSAWLNTILLRLAARSAVRQDRPGRPSLESLGDEDEMGWRLAETSTSGSLDPHAAAEAAELRRELATAIAALPFRYRAAVVTRYVMGLDYAEAAGALELGLNTYKSNLLRGTRMLREALAPIVGRSGQAQVAGRQRGAAVGDAAAEFEAAQLEAFGPLPAGGAVSAAPGPAFTVAASPASGRRADRLPGLASAARSFADPRGARFADRLPREKPLRG